MTEMPQGNSPDTHTAASREVLIREARALHFYCDDPEWHHRIDSLVEALEAIQTSLPGEERTRVSAEGSAAYDGFAGGRSSEDSATPGSGQSPPGAGAMEGRSSRQPTRDIPPAAQVPAEAPAAPEGCEWRHTTLIREGDLLYMGEHDVFGKREAFFHRVVKIEEKPKTFTVTLAPTHPRLIGSEQRRWRKDEWLIVRSK